MEPDLYVSGMFFSWGLLQWSTICLFLLGLLQWSTVCLFLLGLLQWSTNCLFLLGLLQWSTVCFLLGLLKWSTICLLYGWIYNDVSYIYKFWSSRLVLVSTSWLNLVTALVWVSRQLAKTSPYWIAVSSAGTAARRTGQTSRWGMESWARQACSGQCLSIN